MDETREKIKKDGIEMTFSRVPKKWFVKGDKIRIIIYVRMLLKMFLLRALTMH